MGAMSWLARLPRLLPLPAPHADRSHLVLLLHGTGSEPGIFLPLALALRARGVSVHGLHYGRRGTDPLSPSVVEIERHLRHLLIDAPPAARLTIVGHSLGGLLALRVARREEMTGRIERIIGLGAAWRGTPARPTSWRDRVTEVVLGRSFLEVRTDVPFDDSLPEGVEVISVVSDTDRVVPDWSSRLGEIVEVSGVAHNRLPHLVRVIVPLVLRPSGDVEKQVRG